MRGINMFPYVIDNIHIKEFLLIQYSCHH